MRTWWRIVHDGGEITLDAPTIQKALEDAEVGGKTVKSVKRLK